MLKTTCIKCLRKFTNPSGTYKKNCNCSNCKYEDEDEKAREKWIDHRTHHKSSRIFEQLVKDDYSHADEREVLCRWWDVYLYRQTCMQFNSHKEKYCTIFIGAAASTLQNTEIPTIIFPATLLVSSVMTFVNRPWSS